MSLRAVVRTGIGIPLGVARLPLNLAISLWRAVGPATGAPAGRREPTAARGPVVAEPAARPMGPVSDAPVRTEPSTSVEVPRSAQALSEHLSQEAEALSEEQDDLLDHDEVRRAKDAAMNIRGGRRS